MRYLKYRKDFLNPININEKGLSNQIKESSILNESLENDITWGGSLLGRLISSTIRTGKIYYKTARISGLSDQVKTELDNLIEETAFDKEQKEKIKNLKVRFLIEEIYKVVISKDSIDSKLTQLLGDKSDKSGLIMVTISEIEKTQLKDKNKLIEKLKRFREALLGIDFDPKDNVDNSNENDTNSSNNNPEFNFYTQTLNLFKSIIGLNSIIINKRVVIESSIDKKEVDKNKSLQNTNTTKEDKNKSLQNTNTTKEDSKEKTVINDSFFYENESLPIFENVAIIKKSETDAINVWNKILKAFSNSNMPKISIQLQEIIDKSKSGEKLDKSIVIAIGKQVLANEKTLGKPLELEELLKEEAGTIPNEYKDIPKSISLISRVLTPLKDDMGILGTIDEAKSNIALFIKSIGQMRALNVKPVSKNESVLHRYDSFINESDESDESNVIDNKESENTDKVKVEWYKEFKEGEEKEYKVNEEEAKTLQTETEEAGNKEFEIDANSYKDRIIRIVNIFGRAYKLYSVDEIPSGRPGGRISQKTFREYTYIGKDSPPKWDANGGPGYGPWAAIITFEKWENGIMKILEDTKYRSILANAKFTNVGPNQKAGSGKTLFTFINDMIGEGGKDANFRQKRHRLLSEYFNGAPDIEKNVDPVESGPGKISKEDYGKKGDISFVKYSSLNRGSSVLTKNLTPDVNENYNREFVRISYIDDNKTKYLIGFIVGRINGSKDKGVAIKFHLSGKNQSIISTYLKKFIDDKTYNMPNSLVYNTSEKLYIGVINISEHKSIKNGDLVNIKYSPIDGDNRIGKVEDLNIKIKSFESLCDFDVEKGNWVPIKIEGAPDNRPKYDLKDLSLVKTKASEFGII